MQHPMIRISSRQRMKSRMFQLLLILAICYLVGGIGTAATPSKKPQALNPATANAASKQTSKPLPTSSLPLRLVPHERIALVGGSLAERMNLFGNFESLLHTRFPNLALVVRNFARPCDAVDNRQRPNSYTALDDPLKVFGADTFLCFFGFNESFASVAGEEQFRSAYGKYLDEMAQQYPRANGKPPRFLLVSPIAWEPTDNPLWPDARKRNNDLRRYAATV